MVVDRSAKSTAKTEALALPCVQNQLAPAAGVPSYCLLHRHLPNYTHMREQIGHSVCLGISHFQPTLQCSTVLSGTIQFQIIFNLLHIHVVHCHQLNPYCIM